MKEKEMLEIAELIDMALSGGFESNKKAIIERVGQLTARFPLYN
jgi:glycine/serine hydroxymethyltransferase